MRCPPARLSRSDPVLRHLPGSKHLSVHGRARRKNLGGARPCVHPGQRPHGPARTLHPCCCLTDHWKHLLTFTTRHRTHRTCPAAVSRGGAVSGGRAVSRGRWREDRLCFRSGHPVNVPACRPTCSRVPEHTSSWSFVSSSTRII